MEFRLTYTGRLKSKTSATLSDIHDIRRYFDSQLKLFWAHGPLRKRSYLVGPPEQLPKGDKSLLDQVGQFTFASVVSDQMLVHAELDVLFLRPSSPGYLVGHGGDLDNRLKTLMDALRIPAENEIPPNFAPSPDEVPFHCLLRDDALVSALTIRTDRLLKEVGLNDVELVIRVELKATRPAFANMGI